jgi:SAM-dependent methyltransferase
MNNYKLLDSQNSIIDISKNYWNQSSIEKDKPFYIKENIDMLETNDHLNDLYNQLKSLMDINDVNIKDKKILSLGCGTCWLESWLISRSNEKPYSFTGVDFSKHRIHDLAPKTLEHYDISMPTELYCGDMINTIPSNNKYDVIILCQSLHHSDVPMLLLKECRKLLSDNGIILVVGEHYYNNFQRSEQLIKHFVKYIINYKSYKENHYLLPSYDDLFPPCLKKGDIHYSLSQYYFMFKKTKLKITKHIVNKHEGIQGYSLIQEKT